MNRMVPFSDPARYFLFLLVHAAYADHHMHRHEIQFILDRLKGIFPPKADIYEEFLSLKDQYEVMSDHQIENLITENFPRFVRSGIRAEILSWLTGVIKADGVVKDSELRFLTRVTRIIENPLHH